ncbi:YpmS family protein [Metabacillus fastidiosus]|uniref:YpmS family protein n=1 Tax=Metabacillus fastidiosus TaxID=1458 RepID=UPI002DB61714|nr:YpmS family protein [Metabacillus fastidiosus]MEC2075930.1 YpmS family protein [Metabacillus fastidiosus]
MGKWKLAFMILLACNILFVVIITGLIFSSGNKGNDIAGKSEKIDSVPVFVQTDKESLTILINDYLKKESNSEKLEYHVDLKDEVYLSGAVKAFNSKITMEMVFHPEVINEQTMRFYVNELSIGKLKLPIAYVLKYMESEYNFPKAVNINSKKKYIDVHLNELTFNSNMSVHVDSFDLKKDEIAFFLFMPVNE